MARRVLILGLDCAPPRLVFDELADDLPTLTELRTKGLWGPLESSIPPITVPAWMCMSTGRNPGQLGFFGFRNRTPGTYHDTWVADASAVQEPTLWRRLSREGKRVIVLGVPQTYPVTPVNGCLVSSFLTPSTDSAYTYPASLKEEIKGLVGEYILDCENFRTENKQELLDQIHRMTERRFVVLRHLIKTREWDFCMFVEMGPDRLHHGFWKFHDTGHRKFDPGNQFRSAIRDYYILLDNEIRETLEHVDEGTCVMVVSDHGAKAMDGAICVNDWLMREEFLHMCEPLTTPMKINAAPIDWSRTKAWGLGGYYARIYFNMQGREPHGCVSMSEYDALQEEITERAVALTDDTGRTMNTVVYRPQDAYSGERMTGAPDLLIYFDDLCWRSTGNVGHDSIYSFDTEIGPDDAVHDRYGICILHGPSDAQGGAKRTGMTLYDIAPTVFDRLGLAIPPEFEGQVIK